MRDGWGEIELSQVLQLKNTKLGPHVDEPAIFAISKHEGVILASDFFGKRIASKNLDGYKILEPRDWVYSTIHIDEGSIATNHHPHSGVVSPMYTTMSWFSEDNSAGYFELLLRSSAAITIYGENAQGSINRRRSLPFARFSQLKFSVPPLAEQQRIVDLISTVDSYIEALRQQLESAKVSRNAVLHELLTAGGDGWVETPLVEAVEVLDRFRKPVNSTEREKRKGNVPYYGANGQTGWIDDFLFNEELVLLGEDAIDFLDPNARKAYLISGPSWVNNHAHILRVLPERAVSYLLAEALNRVDYSQYVSFGTRSKLTQSSMNGIKILLPQLPEQKRIVDLISTVDSYIDALEGQISSSTSLRSGLLSDLLSGNHEIPSSYDQLIGAA